MKEGRQDFIFDVLRVTVGNVVTLRHDGLRIAKRPAQPRPQMLQHHRIALLRHDRADLDKAVVDVQGVGFLRRSDEQVVRHAAQVDGQRLHGKGRLGQIFAAADGVLRAGDDAVEAEQIGHALAVDGEAGAR